MKSPSFLVVSILVLSLFLLLPILGFVRSGWELWEVVVLCLVFLGAFSAFLASSLRFTVVGRGVGGAIACPARSGPIRLEERVVEDSDVTAREAREEECTVWDCF